MLSRCRRTATLPGLPDRQVPPRIHMQTVRGQPSLARPSSGGDPEGVRSGTESSAAEDPRLPQGVRAVIGHAEQRGAASGEREGHARGARGLAGSDDLGSDAPRCRRQIVTQMFADRGG